MKFRDYFQDDINIPSEWYDIMNNPIDFYRSIYQGKH